MRNYKNYDVWKKADELVINVYEATRNFPKEEVYSLTSQIRRAVLSVPTNISEGCGRESDLEFARFLSIAIGSANEVEYLISISKKLGYLNLEIEESLVKKIILIRKKLINLRKKLI